MQLLQGLAMVAEFGGQPIEQLRMRRSRSVVAEVVGRIDQAGDEVIVPGSVDDGTPGQTVSRVGKPGGQGGAPLPFIVGIGQLEGMGQSANTTKRTGTGN